MARLSVFVVAALLALVAGCPASENVILLEVTTQADVDTLEVQVLDPSGHRTGELAVRVGRTRDDINNREAIRLVIPVGPGGAVTVFVRGQAPSGAGGTRLLATRCYVVSGVLRDDVLLIAVDSSLDADGDGFPIQTSATCRDRAADGSAVGCDIGSCPDAVAGDCADDNPDRFPGNDVICQDMLDQNCVVEMGTGLVNGDEPCEDGDMDGWTGCGPDGLPGTCDCADDNPDRNPDAVENETVGCNDGIDQDCDTMDARCDLDMDGYPSDRMVGGAPDCDDTNELVNPGATEVCGDRVDNNCNRLIDEGADCAPDDLDNDGHMRCAAGSTDCATCDCDDCNSAVHPGASSVCDGLDQITGMVVPPDGSLFPDCPLDPDGDGDISGDCAPSNGESYTGAPENCLTPTEESCDGINMCGSAPDGDMDGFVDSLDCAPADMSINPARTDDPCDGFDNDCDGVADEVDPVRVANGVGCAADPVVCAGTGPCEISFRAPMGTTRHCGGCGIDCNPSSTNTVADQCVGGTCECSTEPGIGACAATDTCCADGCVDRQTDHDNCGSCGVVCSADFGDSPTCVAGTCMCPAISGTCGAATPNCCDSGCVNLRDDANNCGACGHQCGAGASCNNGMCVCDSLDRFDCDGSFGMMTGNGCEADISVPTRCGGCMTNCDTLPHVAVSACGGSPGARACGITTCEAGWGDCDGVVSNGCEVNLNDTRTCGATCAARTDCTALSAVGTVTCTSGSCGITSCAAGRGNCDGSVPTGCEENIWDPVDCGLACAGRSDCSALPRVATGTCPSGSCGIGTCEPGFRDCDGTVANGCEIDLNATTTCGSNCSTTDCTALPRVDVVTCSGGACGITSCDPGFGDCTGGAGCETNLNAVTSCGPTCAGRMDCNALPQVTTGSCSAGSCGITTCDSGFQNCDGTVSNGCEVDLTSPMTCGSTCSTTNCTTLPNVASATCPSGTCNLTCSSGFGDCTGAAGCETNLFQATSCGSGCSGRINCTTLPNVMTGTCSSGTCNITCSPGFENCDGNPANGCEVNLNSPMTCGTTCANRVNCTTRANVMSATCMSGSCNFTCNAGFDDCDNMDPNGCEADLTSTATCRSCGTMCTGTDVCCPTGMACRATCG